MSNKDADEIAICFTAYLDFTLNAGNSDSAEAANMATDMIKHLISKFDKIKDAIMLYDDGPEFLSKLGVI